MLIITNQVRVTRNDIYLLASSQIVPHMRMLWTSCTVQIIYSSFIGTFISGENGRIGFRITNGNNENHFQIANSTGAISVNGALDREQIPSYTLTVEVYDFGYPAPRKVILWFQLILHFIFILIVTYTIAPPGW